MAINSTCWLLVARVGYQKHVLVFSSKCSTQSLGVLPTSASRSITSTITRNDLTLNAAYSASTPVVNMICVDHHLQICKSPPAIDANRQHTTMQIASSNLSQLVVCAKTPIAIYHIQEIPSATSALHCQLSMQITTRHISTAHSTQVLDLSLKIGTASTRTRHILVPNHLSHTFWQDLCIGRNASLLELQRSRRSSHETNSSSKKCMTASRC